MQLLSIIVILPSLINTYAFIVAIKDLIALIVANADIVEVSHQVIMNVHIVVHTVAGVSQICVASARLFLCATDAWTHVIVAKGIVCVNKAMFVSVVVIQYVTPHAFQIYCAQIGVGIAHPNCLPNC